MLLNKWEESGHRAFSGLVYLAKSVPAHASPGWNEAVQAQHFVQGLRFAPRGTHSTAFVQHGSKCSPAGREEHAMSAHSSCFKVSPSLLPPGAGHEVKYLAACDLCPFVEF